MTDFIGANRLKKRLGVGRVTFDKMVAEGLFGTPVKYGIGSQRYFHEDHVSKFFRDRELESELAKVIAHEALV